MRKLIVRADDVGYSKVCNIGAFETVENGIVTSMDIMLDTPGAEDALKRLKKYPWISVGWHTHFWGSPVLGSLRVPSMYDPERNGFRTDLYTAPDVCFEEALAECRTQMSMCLDILGKTPDVGSIMTDVDSPFTRALRQVQEENRIVLDFMGTDFSGFARSGNVAPQWKDRKIFCRGLMEYCKPLKAKPLGVNGWTDSIANLLRYDPIGYYTNDESGLLQVPEDSITLHAWHPGYLDYYVYRHGDYTPGARVFKDIRVVDAHALCSQEVKDWIKENHIELINLRDALYGSCEYQGHLKAVGSYLAV